MAARQLRNWISSNQSTDLRLVKHRLADARWRSSVASCFSLLKEVVLQKDSWDPENAAPTRLTKVTILNETGDYIKKLEAIVSAELELNAINQNNILSDEECTLQKVRNDFMRLESSKYVRMQDVGPYVEKYLELLAMEEEVSKKSEKPEKTDEEPSSSVAVFNPNSGDKLWRIPNFKHKIRKKYRKIPRPTIVNLSQEMTSALRTPRCVTTSTSFPRIHSKNVKVTGCGHPGVKRRLLDEMDEIEDPNSEMPFVTGEMFSSEIMTEDENHVDLVVSEEFSFGPDASFTKILPTEAQSVVPCVEYEVEIASNDCSGKENAPTLRDTAGQRTTRKRKPLQVVQSEQLVPDGNDISAPRRPKRALCEISNNLEDNQVLPVFTVKRSENSAFQDYTALKNSMRTPEYPSTFVKFEPLGEMSPKTPDFMLTQGDPLLTFADSSQRSPAAVQYFTGPAQGNTYAPVVTLPGSLWASPNFASAHSSFDSHFFDPFFH